MPRGRLQLQHTGFLSVTIAKRGSPSGDIEMARAELSPAWRKITDPVFRNLAAPAFFGFLKDSFQRRGIQNPAVEPMSFVRRQASALHVACEGQGSRKEGESVIFYAIFWSAYVPFAVLTLSLLVERLFHHATSDVARQAQPVRVSAKSSNRSPNDAAASR
jgi:hypothetical protein